MTASKAQALPRPERLDDDQLMALINAGEAEDGLRELQRRYEDRVFRTVLGYLQDPQLAQEVTSEVFAKIFFKSHLYRPQGNFTGWLFEVARNHALSTLRARRRRPVPVSSLPGSGDDADEDDILQLLPDGRTHREAEEHEFEEAFRDAVERLPERYRTVFDLCVRRGLPYKETAERLGLPTGTVAIRIMRARRRLFQELSRHLDRIRRLPACFE